MKKKQVKLMFGLSQTMQEIRNNLELKDSDEAIRKLTAQADKLLFELLSTLSLPFKNEPIQEKDIIRNEDGDEIEQ